MRIEPELSNVSVVLIGGFNPSIFSPDWFFRRDLITENDNQNQTENVEVIHREIAIFKLNWVNLRIERNRFIAETTESPYVRLADFVAKTFLEQLPHTPVTALGINRVVHFDVGSFERREMIGNILAPKDAWGEWGPKITGSQSLAEHGGLRSLTMQQKKSDDKIPGYINAKVEPSSKIGQGATGIFMEVNDHFELAKSKEADGCQEIVSLLLRDFETSIRNSEWIIDQVMRLKDE